MPPKWTLADLVFLADLVLINYVNPLGLLLVTSFLAPSWIIETKIFFQTLKFQIMADLSVKEHAEQVDKDYKLTVIKFNNKEAVDNQLEAMKMNGYMIMQVGGLKSFLQQFACYSRRHIVPS